MAQEIVAELFRALRWTVIPFGVEMAFAYLLEPGRKVSPALLHAPDFVVLEPEDRRYFVEVKFSWRTSPSLAEVLGGKSKLREALDFWQHWLPLMVICCTRSGEILFWRFRDADDIEKANNHMKGRELTTLLKKRPAEWKGRWEVAQRLLKEGVWYAD